MALIVALVLLALVDSSSVGTLFVPVLLMLTPGRLRALPLLGYLATIAAFYLAVGVAVLLGAGPLLASVGSGLGRTGYWLQLAAGVALFALSFRFDPKRRPDAARETGARWTARVHKAVESPRALVTLALTAGLLEVATMFPYLGAIALLAGSGFGTVQTVLVLAGYCVIMILPAVVLLGLRLALSERVTPVLDKLNGWFERHAVGATGWILAIVGVLLALDAADQLGLWAALSVGE